MTTKLSFKTNTLLKNLVGKDLINDDNIAIVELVKNSYDARSDEVIVRFTDFSIYGQSTDTSQIIITDYGHGMSISDIENKWLNIAYSEKKLVEQENGAYLAGNKGIGRFSCDRLGSKLDLLTCVKGGDILYLPINWLDFEKEGNKDLTIQSIPLTISKITNNQAAELAGLQEFPEHGTVLVISQLRSQWDREKLRDLKTSLEKFLNPNQLFLHNQFKINLSVPVFEKSDATKNYAERVTGYIQNQIFDKLKFNSTFIESKISHDGKTIKTILSHEGEDVFRLYEHNELYPLLAGTHIVIYYLNPYKKAYFKRQTGIRLLDFGSIFLFLNGFRIAPYGDRGDDWLGIDVRKTQGTARYLSSRDIVGRIEITGDEEQFKPISSREGLKKTPHFIQLRDAFFLDVLRKLEKFVVEGLQWDSVSATLRNELRNSEGLDWSNTAEQYSESWERKKQRIVLSMMTLIGSSPDRIISFWFNPALLDGVYESRESEVKRLIAEIEQFDPEKVEGDLTKSLSRFREIIAEKEAKVIAAQLAAEDLRIKVAEQQEVITDLQGKTETYRAQTLFLQQISSHDIEQLISYHHQINLDATIADNYIAKAIKELRGGHMTQSVMENLQKASFAHKRIAVIAQYATKANFRSGIKKESTDIPAFIEQYLIYVAKDFNAADLRLDISNNISRLFEIKVSRIELSILIDNIISNAKKAHATKITVDMSLVSENTLRISFIDDGRGLSKEISNPDSIFEIGVTTTSGSGLGLYHARTIVDKIDGKIFAIPHKPRGMEIRVEIMR